jgi:small subunit ribosomal protein S4
VKIYLQFCESRLDNVVFRLGIAPTRSGARQLVSHRHITVNGKLVNIPSYIVNEGDVIGVREKSKSLEAIERSSLSSHPVKSEWLDWDKQTMTGTFICSSRETTNS